MNASIITIGDELLIGQVIDTNSAWMAQLLNKSGIHVIRRVAVGDSSSAILKALDEEKNHSELILITGGLGPTADDITKPVLCEYFKSTMITDAATLEHITYLYREIFKKPISERNRKQADVPDNCIALKNTLGTAPGMWFEKDGCIFISLPGVPHEMKGIMEFEVIPKLTKQKQLPIILHRTLVTFGIGESALADKLTAFEEQLPVDIKLAYLPHFGMVRLRLSIAGTNQELASSTIDKQFEALKVLVSEHLVTTEDEPMEAVLARLLKQANKTVSTAESCTGGYIAHLLTSLSGSSAYYSGSVVAYSYQAKEDLIHVPQKIIMEYGAVSKEVVSWMAKGLLKQLHSDYTIAVSGIMGPDGGTNDKPVGTVWVAVGNADKIICRKFHFRHNRHLNIQLTAVNALYLLIRFIRNEIVD